MPTKNVGIGASTINSFIEKMLTRDILTIIGDIKNATTKKSSIVLKSPNTRSCHVL
jgi:hypothetical protein